MTQLRKGLNLFDGVTLGIGSIMGSGVLFLPSYTHGIAGDGAVLSWIFTTLLCFPLIVVFKVMVDQVPNESGLHGWVSLGLGQHIGNSVPYILLGTVILGMPIAAIIAGSYVSNALDLGTTGILATAISIVAISTIANILGIKAGSTSQKWVAGGLFIVAGALIFLSTPSAIHESGQQTFQIDWHSTAMGSVVAFWAFAGFENMSFMAGEFKNPRRDLPLAIVISLIICASIYFFLTLNYTLLTKSSAKGSLDGLNILASATPFSSISIKLLAAFAFVAVLTNFISWIWGISRLIFATAKDGLLPQTLGKLETKSQTPRAAILALSTGFVASIAIFSQFPHLIDTCLRIVSTNFLFIYLLAVAAYFQTAKTVKEKILGAILGSLCLYGLIVSGSHVFYPLTLVAVSALYTNLKKESRSHDLSTNSKSY